MIEVTQADREAADPILNWLYGNQRKPRGTSSFIVQAFARHRTTAEAAKDARIKELEAKLAKAREALKMIEVVEQGCGGTLTFKEMAESAMRHARAAIKEIDNG